MSNKIKGSNETSKVFIGYMDDTNVVPLCLILPQMSGWIKYFENGGKNMSFKIEDDEVYIKYNDIWKRIKRLLGGIKLHSVPIYHCQYIKTKVKKFNEVIKTLFDGGEIPKGRIEHVCIACISVYSVLRIDKKIIHRFI